MPRWLSRIVCRMRGHEEWRYCGFGRCLRCDERLSYRCVDGVWRYYCDLEVKRCRFPTKTFPKTLEVKETKMSNCTILTEKTGDCTCYDKCPTVPVARDLFDHLPDCPAYRSGIPVGCESALQTLKGVMQIVQCYQPAGSPPPGGAIALALWTLTTLKGRVEELESENTTLKAIVAAAEATMKKLELIGQRMKENMSANEAFIDAIRPYQCISFGADPDLKPGPMTQEDRGWNPNVDN